MTFAYDTTMDTPLDEVRFAVGDTSTPHHLVENEEITALLAKYADNVLVVACKIAQHLAARFAREADFAMDEQSVKLSQKSKRYEELAARLSSESSDGGIQTIVTTKLDGYQPLINTKNATDRENYENEDFDAGRFVG